MDDTTTLENIRGFCETMNRVRKRLQELEQDMLGASEESEKANACARLLGYQIRVLHRIKKERVERPKNIIEIALLEVKISLDVEKERPGFNVRAIVRCVCFVLNLVLGPRHGREVREIRGTASSPEGRSRSGERGMHASGERAFELESASGGPRPEPDGTSSTPKRRTSSSEDEP